MIILVRIRDIPGRCRLPGYEVGWFEADSVDYGVENTRPSQAGEDGGVRGLAKFQVLKITKIVDTSSCDLMFKSAQGQPINSVEIQVVETAKGGLANFPYLLMRFQDVFLSNWSLNLDGSKSTETVTLEYHKVAMEYHRTSDGVNYHREATRGWDVKLEDTNGQLGAPWDYTFKLRGDKPMK